MHIPRNGRIEQGTGSRAVNFHPGEREAASAKINADRVAEKHRRQLLDDRQ